jgi:transcriptional regulator with XRE-family HTH domain
MNLNGTISSAVPLHVLLRRRRTELKLLQAQIAEALKVTPECVTLWEAGRRRMELSKLPRLAEVLQVDAKALCAKALAEFHPLFYYTLFGNDGH